MPLHLYRSNRTEQLIAQLANNLAAAKSDDPFVEIPIVVGSRGMERWLRNQIATHRGIATRLAFPFPQPAFDGGVALLLGVSDPSLPFWAREQADGGWRSEALPWRVVTVLRDLLRDPATEVQQTLARVTRYLLPGDESALSERLQGPISAREHAFAGEVAQAIDEVLRQRPDTALLWRDGDPATLLAEDDGWLALVLRRLLDAEAADDTDDKRHPMWRRRTLAESQNASARRATVGGPQPTMHVFGLSTLPAEEVKTLALISGADGLDVHLYMLAPSRAWFGDMPTREETRTKLRQARQQTTWAALSAAEQHGTLQAILDADEQKNRLLADLGRPSRDVQALLEVHAGNYEEAEGDNADHDLFASPAAADAGVLHGLQADLLHAAAPPTDPGHRRRLSADDASLCFHPCHGPLRQVEVLRDQLLHAFSQDKTLQPRDVLVMTPDIATYAPLVAAVLGDEGQGLMRLDRQGRATSKLPKIPVDIADLGLRATNGVADVLLSVLELATERVTLTALLNLLQLPPLRERFGLTGDDFADLQRILSESGLRWGIDAADRAAADQPQLHQNTVAFAMERVALGALFLDETDLIDNEGRVLEVKTSGDVGADGASADFVPFDALNASSVARFGQLYSCIATLLHHRAVVQTPASGAVWKQRLNELIRGLTATTDTTAWLTGRVTTAVDALCDAATGAVHDTPIALAALRTELQGRFDDPRRGDRPIHGGVSVCAMEPMRSVPFRVVVLLGMDQAVFPRQSRRRAWHPMAATRRMGEHDPRDVDRHLLLEALLSARDRVWVFWTGFDLHTDEALPEAVAIRELAEAIDATHLPPLADSGEQLGESASEWLTRPGTLQPWSADRFSSNKPRPTILGFDRAMCDAAQNLQKLRRGESISDAARVQPGALNEALMDDGQHGPLSVDVTTLARALANPAKVLLTERFGLRLQDEQITLSEREALQLDSLQRWQLRDESLQLVLAGQGPEAADFLARRWRAEGTLPIGPAAVAAVQAQVQTVTTMMAAALEAIYGVDGAVGPAVDRAVEAAMGAAPLRLGAPLTRVASLHDDELGTWGVVLDDAIVVPDPKRPNATLLLVPTAGSLSLKRALTAWLAMLVTATAEPVGSFSGALLISKGKNKKNPAELTWFSTPVDAEQQLRTLLRLWRRCQREPVPLFEKTSWALAAALADQEDDATWFELDAAARMALRVTAMTAWSSGFQRFGDDTDRWITAVWGEPDFDAALPDWPSERADAADDTPPAEPPWIQVVRQVLVPIVAGTCAFDTRPEPAPHGDEAVSRGAR